MELLNQFGPVELFAIAAMLFAIAVCIVIAKNFDRKFDRKFDNSDDQTFI